MFLAVIAMVLTVFNACQKDGLEIDQGTDLVATETPDVYLEEDYLVFKDYKTLERIKEELKNQPIETQKQWEQQFGFKSAKTYRVEICKKLEETEEISVAESFIFQLEKEGYFSVQDSSITYPFYNLSWETLLNKNGLIKISGVLYCFQKDRQLSVLDGQRKTLDSFSKADSNIGEELVKVNAFSRLKSTTPVNYGEYASVSEEKKLNYLHRLTISFRYEPIQVYDYIAGGEIQVGIQYELYFHEERKQNWWWIDWQAHFSHQHISYDIGGNYDPIQGMYFSRFINNTPSSWAVLNSSELANYHLVVDQRDFSPSTWINPGYSTYTGPTIHNFVANGKSDKVDIVQTISIN